MSKQKGVCLHGGWNTQHDRWEGIACEKNNTWHYLPAPVIVTHKNAKGLATYCSHHLRNGSLSVLFLSAFIFTK